MKDRNGPKIVSSATAWRTLLDPIRLERLADHVARRTPMRTRGFQKVNSSMNMQSLWSSVGSHVRLVSRLSRM